MNQQINLYQPQLWEKKPPLPGSTILLVGVLALLLILLLSALTSWRQGGLESDLALLEARQKEAIDRIAEAQSKYPPRQKDPALEAQLATLTGERNALIPLFDLLATGKLGNTRGFSPLLAGLARQGEKELWLRRVTLEIGGEQLVLEGSALRPEIVPRYLQQLSREEAFSGREFSSLKMNRPEEHPGRVDFLLRTTPEVKR